MKPFRLTAISLTLPLALTAGEILQAQSVWTELTPSTLPPARFNHGMAFDSDRGRIVVHGGASTEPLGTILEDTWEWDGIAWTQMSPIHSPGPLTAHIMVFDPLRKVTVVFGGAFPGGLSDEVWEWNGQDWTQVAFANGPSARAQFAATWSDALEAIVIHGGIDASIPFPRILGDTWAYDGSWRQLGNDSLPAHSHVLAAHGNMLYSLAGLNALGPTSWSDIYRMDLSDPSPTWSEVIPLRGLLHLATPSYFTDPGSNLTYIHGGSGSAGVVDDTVVFDPLTGDVAMLVSPQAERPPASSGGRFAMDADGTAIHLGGSGMGMSWNDMYEFDAAGRAISIASLLPGCDTGGPVIEVLNPPVLGETFLARVSGGLHTGPVSMLMGFNDHLWGGSIVLPAELTPFGMPGCFLYTDVLVAPVLTTVGDTADFALPIPNQMRFDGTRFYIQAAVITPGANGLGILGSGKVSSQIGM